ncbi:RNA-binding Sun protein [Spiroplasma culicicola AES-1]|uniref:RNA-binding Sun protein n=2 Tax=Spiroplasma culicicola TaxID=216935 RepID=W6A7W0_9MOLU|nr:RNA-binding Sun protein [Spiroplasma culicicola AES-1]
MNSRFKAWEIIYKVIVENQFSNKLLNNLAKQKAMSSSDIAFIFKLVYGTIQYKIYLEYVVNKIIDASKTNMKIQILLWMVLYQMKFLNQPDYSIVNESVEAAKLIDKNSSGFVNAISKQLLNQQLWIVDIKNKQNIFPLKNGFPFWLFQQIKNDYGIEIANQIVLSSNQDKRISFRVNETKISKQELYLKYKDDYQLEESKIASNCLIANKNIIASDLITQGLIYIQDETSILAVEQLNLKSNTNILDLCCAPGGKLSYMCAIVDKNTIIDANEINNSKEKIILENLNRLDLKNFNLYFGDGIKFNSQKKYDSIMLDAPCSGYGVLKRKPEIKLKKYSNEEVEQLLLTQEKLLDNAASLLNAEGSILYSTCTVNKKENQDQIQKFLTRHNTFRIIFEKQFFGFEGNNNGFYICKIKKF